MHIVNRLRFSIFPYVVIALLGLMGSAFFSMSPVFAADDPGPKEGGCVGGYSTGLSSPFGETEGMCLGDAGSGVRFYQFAVKLPKAIDDVKVTSSAKHISDGSSLSFVQESDTLFVSQMNDDFMGYQGTIDPANCNKTDAVNNVSVTVTGPGSGNSQTIPINLCSSQSTYLIYKTASNIKDEDGDVSGTTGTIRGNLGIERTDPLVSDRFKKGPLEKQGITSIKLTGPTAQEGDNSSDWYTLDNGSLTIPDLKPGTYTLAFTYNDKVVLSQQGGDAGWTTGSKKYEFKNIIVVAGKDAWIGGSSDSETYYQTASAIDDDGPLDEEGDSTPTSCAIDGVGWMICPVMNFLAEMNEKAFEFLQSLLGIRPSLVQDKGTVGAWEKFRDIANVAFVIAFMVIIYSQITSVGISNYGIKKLLPKIAIAAIMVNLSLFFCQILVDLSNIAGASLYSFISGLVPNVAGTTDDSGWTSLMTGVLAAGVGVLLVVLIVTAPTVLLALGLILLILVARQAFILILVIISPLAFVAYLLPNTESLFKKWWKALSATLLVYPIIAIVFGASTLASNILMGIASQNGNPASADASDDNQMLAIVALAVMAIPLFAVPVILKGAMSGAGKIGATLAGLQDKANRKASGQAKDRAGKEFKDLGNRFTNRALSSTSRRGAAARAISGVGRRVKRDDRYKQNQTLRDASQENFLNQGINLRDPTSTQGLSKTAQRRVAAGAAKKTADTSNQIIGNMGTASSMSSNPALHQAAAYSNKATHHEEETLKNQGETRYYSNPRNAGHIAEGITAQENRQSAETNAVNRAKAGNTTVRQAIRDSKESKGEEKIIDQGIELAFQGSEPGIDQAKRVAVVETQIAGVKAETDARIQELKAGPEKAGPDGNRLDVNHPEYQMAVDLSAADTATRAQTQRSASAQNIANVEYAGQVKASEGQTGGLAKVAGGIDPQGASRAVAVATQVIDKQLTEAIGAQKTLFESIENDELKAEYETGFVGGDPSKGVASPERLAAVAGTIAGRGFMGGKLDLLKATGPALARAKAAARDRGLTTDEEIDSDPAVKAIIYSQKQMASDMREWPFGAGDTMRDKLGIGDWEGDFDGSFQARIGTDLTGEKLGTMKTEEMADLESIHDSLTPGQKASLDRAVEEAKTNDNVRKTIKPKIWDSLERMGYTRPDGS